MTWRTGSALSIAAVLAACSSADGQSATSQPGALRARSVSGADLGFVYAGEPVWQFAVKGVAGSVALPMVMLKEQPAGAAGPVLVWRAMQSGSALECARYYQSADCSGAATIGPSQAGTVCMSGGRMYRPNFAAAETGQVLYGSAAFPRWDPEARQFTVECGAGPIAAPPFMLPAVDAGPAAASPGRIYLEPAD